MPPLCTNCRTVLTTLYSPQAPLTSPQRWYTFPSPSVTCQLCAMMEAEIPKEKLERGGLAKLSFNASMEFLKGWVGGELVFAFPVKIDGLGMEDGWSLRDSMGWVGGDGCAIPGRGGGKTELDVERLSGLRGMPIFVEDTNLRLSEEGQEENEDEDATTIEEYRGGKTDRERVALARKWIADCHEGHKSCKLRRDFGFAPSRLVDVERGKLVDTTTQESLLSGAFKYAAFSYVWGPPHSMPESGMTTTSNLSSRLSKLDFTSLPRAFRDVLVVAKSLGIPYLWIDALCILQDSLLDWEEQCSQMGMIYSNAHLTISASSISFCNDSIPFTRTEPPTPCKFQLEYPSSHRVNFSISPTPLTWSKFQEKSPLSKRGWTFQERELSPRILHFAPDQIRWECRTHKLLESPLPSHDHIEDPMLHQPKPVEILELSASKRVIESKHEKEKDIFLSRLYGAPAETSLQLRCLDSDANLWTPVRESDIAQKFFVTEARFNTWHRVITYFSSRAFTRIEDRLPALSGLVGEMQRAYGGEYVAGMWGGDLLRSLLWRRAGDEKKRRPVEYRGPSWSWVAIHNAVSYDLVTLNRPQIDKLDPCTAYIESLNVVPAGADPYGRLKSGYIDIKGKLKLYTPSSFTRKAKFLYDFDKESGEEGVPVYLLSLFASRSGAVGTRGVEGDLKTVWALALVVVDGEGMVCRRVGVVGGILAEWFEDAGVGRIRIV